MFEKLEQPISDRFRYDSAPAFRLNLTRLMARSRFIDAIESGEIALAKVNACECGSTNLHTIAEQDRFGLPFRAALCRDCALILTTPRISESSLATYYQKFYHPLVLGTKPGEAKDELVREAQGKFIFDFLKDELLSQSTDVLRICEIGCGSGANLVALRELCKANGLSCELYGTEYEPSHAKVAANHGIKVLESDVNSLRSFNVRFHLVVMSHIFEHFHALKQAMTPISQILEPKGLIYIEVPGIRRMEAYGNDFLDYHVHAHMFHFELASLSHVLATSGFDLVRGNEVVQGIFVKRPEGAAPSTASSPRKIAENIAKHLLALEKQNDKQALSLKRAAIKLLGWAYKIENRILSRNKLKERFFS